MCNDPSTAEFFVGQQSNVSNNICCDFGSDRQADWASVSHGIYISIEASGIHRSLGVKTSFVLSTKMDSWKPVYLRMMELGGNKRFKDFMGQHGVPDDWPIRKKYSTRAAAWYRENLKAEAEGSDLPAPLEVGTGHLAAEGMAEESTTQASLLDRVFASIPSSSSTTAAGGVCLDARKSTHNRAKSARPRLSDSATLTSKVPVSDAAAVFGVNMSEKLKAAIQVSSGSIACLVPWKLEGGCVARRLRAQSSGNMDGFGSESLRVKRLATAVA